MNASRRCEHEKQLCFWSHDKLLSDGYTDMGIKRCNTLRLCNTVSHNCSGAGRTLIVLLELLSREQVHQMLHSNKAKSYCTSD